jgi:feruloyl-CoA synthase
MPTKVASRVRDVRISSTHVIVERRENGAIYVKAKEKLGNYPSKITERLEHWAKHAPGRTFLAQRDSNGEWRRVTYSQALRRVRGIAQGLLDRKLSASRPVGILSGNSIEHALLALAAMYVGVTYAPLAPAYSLAATEYKTLHYIWNLIKPTLVFAAHGDAYARALRSVVQSGTEIIVVSSSGDGLATTMFDELESTSPTSAIDAAHTQVGPDTIAKILFTSGSTGQPKAVINTQRMLCSNQQMIRSVMPFLADEPPVLCDWLPWNHTFGGNHNFGMVLYNGGTLYIDEGKPTSTGFEITAKNLREIATTAYFNVPRGYEMLAAQLRTDSVLRDRFFSRLLLLFNAAAGLTQRVWDELQDHALQACGEQILMMTGLGATESSPAAFFTSREGAASGMVGLPAPGVELKLVPVEEKMEARLRGPNITPGFWRQEERNRIAFDEEGFYKLGDALKFVDPDDPQKGFAFDGRITEDFKLSTGTWVSVGPLRAKLLAHFGGWADDVVIAAPDRDFLSVLIFPSLRVCRDLCPSLDPDATVRAILDYSRVREKYQTLLDGFASHGGGSSTRVVRAILLDRAASLDRGEITDKGSINQKVVLQNRSALVEELYEPKASSRVIEITRGF